MTQKKTPNSDVPSTRSSGREIGVPEPAGTAIPPEVDAWLLSSRFEVPDRLLKEETVEALPAWLAAARTAAAPASRNEAKVLLARAVIDIPPRENFDRTAAMPGYLDSLADLPRIVLEQALADCRNTCLVWPSIAAIRLAAELYMGPVMRRLVRLQKLAEHAGLIERPRRNRSATVGPL